MKQIRYYLIFTVFILTSVLSSSIFAQYGYVCDKQKSLIEIKGTSTLHDWEMFAKEFCCSFTTDNENLKDSEIIAVSFNSLVEKITSDNSLMDSKTRKALKSDKYPVIDYEFLSQKKLTVLNNNISGEINGMFTIAGKTKGISIAFTGKIIGENSVSIKGEVSFLMTEFDVQPPSALLGTIKAGDKVTILFDFTFDRKQISN